MLLNAILISTLLTTGAASLAMPSHASSPIALSPIEREDVVLIEVGNRRVAGSLLRPFDAEWVSSGLGPDARISEVSHIERADGRKCYVRKQSWPTRSPGIEVQTRLFLDARTLETIRLEREVVGLPEGASLGGAPTMVRWKFQGPRFVRTEWLAGEETNVEGALEKRMFDGGALGLVIAALPLKDGYEAQLPVAMPLGQSVELTRYLVHIRVVGQESFPHTGGREVKAWIVAVDWIDPETGEVTSEGGVNGPGGAYFVVPKPPKGFPHVPRYANDGGVIDLANGD